MTEFSPCVADESSALTPAVNPYRLHASILQGVYGLLAAHYTWDHHLGSPFSHNPCVISKKRSTEWWAAPILVKVLDLGLP